MKNEKPVPDELKEIWLDKEAADELRDSYVKRPFGFKKALKCSKLARQKHSEFWTKISDLYPELGPNMGLIKTNWTVYKDEKDGKK